MESHPHQGNFFVKETVTENRKQAKYRAVEPSSMGSTENTAPAPGAQGPLRERSRKDCERIEARVLPLLGLSEATPIESHQQECLKGQQQAC